MKCNFYRKVSQQLTPRELPEEVGKIKATRTVTVRSIKLPRKTFRTFVELESMYRNIIEQLTIHAVRNEITSFLKLKALKYDEIRNLYPQLPSHYAYTTCQDTSTRVKSFIKRKKKGLAKTTHPEVRNISIWLDDHLWRLDKLTSIKIATHKGWIRVEFEPHKHYWRYLGKEWRLSNEARIKLDKRNRQLIIYLTFYKDVKEYAPRGYMPVDVNEDNITTLVDGIAYLLETDMRKLVLGYYYRRKRIQEKYDKLYGVDSRAKRKVMGRLKECEKKEDVRWKVAGLIVRRAYEEHYAIILEDLGRNAVVSMIKDISDEQLRHRIYQASFRGIQKAIVEKAKEYGVPVIYVSPRNTSKVCPIHKAPIKYDSRTRVGVCSVGGELWHRDVVSCWNQCFRVLGGDVGIALSPLGSTLDGSPVPLDSTATHEPIRLSKSLWARLKSLPQIHLNTEQSKMK